MLYKQTSLRIIRDQSNSQNTLLHLKKQNPDKQVFITKQQRFSNNQSKHQQPGPGQYIDPLQRSRLLQKEKYQQNNKNINKTRNHLDSFVPRQHQWIFGSDRLTYVNRNSGSGIGPGAYDVRLDPYAKNAKKISDSWSKAERFNGTEWGGQSTSIGPGYYEDSAIANIKPRKRQMGIFKSKSPKSFLEQLSKSIQKKSSIQASNHQPKSSQHIQTIGQSQIQQLQKLTENIQLTQKQKSSKKMDPTFLSKSKRYELINPESNNAVGPGSYNIGQNILDELKKNNRKKVHSISTSTNFVKQKNISSYQTKTPGPTSYNINAYNLQRQIQQKISSIKGNMALQTRFKSQWKKSTVASTLPGPGHYNKQKYIFVNQKQYQHKPLVIHHDKIQVPFLSSSSRVIQQSQSQSPNAFGNYNLNQYDLSQKARKKRLHVQKLKLMDISVPGFESKQRRTTWNLSKMIKKHLGLGRDNYSNNTSSGDGAGNVHRIKSNSSLHKD